MDSGTEIADVSDSDAVANQDKRRLLVLTLSVVGIAVALSLIWLPSAKAPASVYPSPNGYDDFVEATKLISTTRPGPGTHDVEEWRAFLTDNQGALDRVRLGLGKSCLSSNHYDSAGDALPDRLDGFRHLAQAFRAEHHVATADKDTNTVTKSAIECLRFGIESSRGGALIESLVGQAIQSVSMQDFRKTIPTLDHANSTFALSQLILLEPKVPTAQDILDKENSVRYQFTSKVGYLAYLVGFNRKRIRELDKKIVVQYHSTANHRRSLAAQLAKRLYELDHGKPASGWPDVVPKYLPAIPTDAETGKPLLFP